jgi:hypothetical protein
MTIRGTEDHAAIDEMVADLAVHDAPPERVEQVRGRCLAALARRREKAEARRQAAARWRGRLEAAVAAGLAALYLAGVVERALEILG